MISPRRQFIELIEQRAIPADRIRDGLRAAQIAPDNRAWLTFIDRLLLWFGGLALAFALLFFIAYNWVELGRFAKFGLVESCMILAIAAYCRLGAGSAAGRVALFAATICLGVVLALYGQTYQTGADPWQLFCNWALLMLPWAVIGRFAALWLVWIALMNTTVILSYTTFGGLFWFSSETGMLWLCFLFNTLILAAWEVLTRQRDHAAERWGVRLVAIGGGVPLTGLVLHAIFAASDGSLLAAPVWLAWLAAMYLVYRRMIPDLFMLAGCCLSGITVTVSYVGEKMLDHGDAFSFLFLAALVIGLGTGAAIWLKNLQQELQA